MKSFPLTLIRQFPVGPGGAERYLDLLVRGLVSHGFKVTLVCADCPPHPFDIPDAKVDIVRLDAPHISKHRMVRPWLFPWMVQRWLTRYPQKFVFSLERHWKQDLLRSGDGIHAEWLLRRAPMVGPIQNFFTQWNLFHRSMVWSESRAYDPTRTLRVMANSHFVKDQIVRRYHFPESRIEVVHNGVDLQQWRSGSDKSLRTKLGLDEKALLAFFPGSGWERKGLAEAVRYVTAWSEQTGRPARLAVAGKGHRGQYKSPLVEWLGVLRRSEMSAAYRGSDITILPTRYDPFANVTLESLASGTPVLTTKDNGAYEILEDGVDGAVMRDRMDARAAAEQISHLLSRTSEQVQAACRRKAEAYGMEDHIEKVIALCLSVAEIKAQMGDTPPLPSDFSVPTRDAT